MPENDIQTADTEAPDAAAVRLKNDKNSGSAFYRLMSEADTYFAKKNYNEAYLGYSSALESDPHCSKAIFRIEVTSRYLVCETAASYVGSQSFFRKTSEIITGFLEGHADNRLILTSCRDMLDFIHYDEEYERKFALYKKTEKAAASYIRDLIDLLYYILFLMNCIIRVNDRDSAFVAMKCYAAGSEVYKKLCKGMEYYKDSESSDENNCLIREMTRLEREKADELLTELDEIRKSILKNADDELYSELKESEKKHEETDIAADKAAADLNREEYENWRKRNEKEYFSADKKNIISGIAAKTAFVFALVMAVIFIFETLVHDDILGVFALSAVIFAAAGLCFSVLEKRYDKRRRFYAKLVYNGAEQFQAAQKNIRNVS